MSSLVDLLEREHEYEGDFKDLLARDYQLGEEEAKELVSLVESLRETKDQIGEDFRELPFMDFREQDGEGRQRVYTSFEVSFHPNLMAHMPVDFDFHKRSFVVPGYSQTLQEEVTIKLSADVDRLEKELLLLRYLYQHGEQVSKVFSTSVEEVMSFSTYDGTSHSLCGFVIERGGESLQHFLQNRPSLLPSERRVIANKLVSLVDFIHKLGKVWLDLKTSNFLHFPDKDPDWRMISFANVAECWEEIETEEGLNSVYVAPEVVRGLKEEGEEEEEEEGVTAFPSMDVWSLGVCLMEVMSGKQLFALLGLPGKEDLEALYMQEDFEEAVSAKISAMIDTMFLGDGLASFRDLLSNLLVVKASERTFTAQNALDHPFFTLPLPTTAASETTTEYLLAEFGKMMDRHMESNGSFTAQEAFDELQVRLASMSEGQRWQFDVMEQYFEQMKDRLEEKRETQRELLMRQQNLKKQIKKLTNELNARIMSHQLSHEDIASFRAQVEALEEDPSVSELQEIKAAMEDIYYRF
jgi:serine/threonine protein kinase